MAPYYTASHIPPVASSEWRQETISLTNTWGSNPVRFKFKFTSGGGNNIFIDDINIFGISTSIAQTSLDEDGVKIYPNPANNNLNIILDLTKNSEIEINIKDVTGKTLLAKNNKLLKGENKLQVETTNLSSGLYFVQIKNDDVLISIKKIVISK